jgi:CRISPR system Cascade subunit CasC
LTENLQNDGDLTKATVDAFLRASVDAIPTGKQTTMAAQNKPSFVFAVARDHGLWSLANAFTQPVRPTSDKSLVQRSAESLDDYWGRMSRMYGNDGIRAQALCSLEDLELNNLGEYQVDSVSSVVDRIMQSVGQPTAEPTS